MCLQLFGYLCCYCCLKNCRPRCIEFSALISNIIEIVVLVWAIIEFPWKDIKIIGRICFFIMFVLIIFNFLFLLILMYLRCSNKINTTKNGYGKCLCITMIVFDIISFILYLVGGVVIILNMNDHENDYYGLRIQKRETKYSKRKWISLAVSLSITEIFIIFHCICSMMLYKIIKAKINTSYSNYLDQPKKVIITNVNAYNNTQTDINMNQLTHIGYDKDGRPIYSGNVNTLNQNNSNTNIMFGGNTEQIMPQGNRV